MQSSIFTFTAADGIELFVYRWLPEHAPRGIVQIAHGLSEHAGRYARLGAALADAGWAVYANDHRGHGRTARTKEDLGFFAERDGWQKCIDDLWRINRRISMDHPGLPVIFLGHSMGSFMAQHFIIDHGEALAACVLSGSNGKPAGAGIARLIAGVERWRLGPRGKSALLVKMFFGAFNKPFEPARTPFDWLSRDPAEVDKYIADPLCGFAPSAGLWIDLLWGLREIARPSRQARIPRHLPIHIISGGLDPVSAKTKGVERLQAAYRAAGLARLTHRYYDGARHELFNETNREEVTRDL